MDSNSLICETQSITYDKGYIALWLPNYSLPETINIDEITLLKKDTFHVSLLCVDNLLKARPESEAEILQYFCDFLQKHKLVFEGFTGEFRLAKKDERKSIVALCAVSHLDTFAQYLTEKLGMPVPLQPAHVTLYTLQPNAGIGLNSPEEMQEKSQPIQVPKELIRALI